MTHSNQPPQNNNAKASPKTEDVLQVEKRKVAGGGVQFILAGEFTYVSGTDIVNAVAREIVNNQTSNVTLEMTQVSYMDSFGIGCLLKIHNIMQEQRGVTGNLVVQLSEKVFKRVKSTGLDKIVRIVSPGQ